MIEDKKTIEFRRELAKKIRENDDFLIITHIFPDGDAIGSLISFHKFILSLGKNSRMVCNSDLPYQYKFLAGFDEIEKESGIKEINTKKYICIVLDCADMARTGMDLKSLKKSGSYIVNIDHHGSNDLYGDLNIVDSGKSATAEIVFEFIDNEFKGSLDRDIATSIYVGILTDTGRFQYSNTTASVHYIIARLLEYGIYPSDIYGHIYESDPLGRFKLIQKVFDRIKYIESLRLIYSYVLKEDLVKLKIPFYAQDGIIDLLRSAETARITALIKQVEKQSFKISLRTSESGIDLSRIASNFGGGGHRTASAYSDRGMLEEVIERLKSAVRKEVSR